MHIKSLRVEQFKRFRQPVSLDKLEPGLNIISAPNEAGKSTLAEALRTVFFERYGTGSLTKILPWGDSSAAPEIELDFSLNGQDMRLSKRFLKRKRCDLYIGNQHLDNDEAEQYLAQQMGFEYAAKGSSQARNWGVPGLLWIEQGQGQDLRSSVEHASGTLQQALGSEIADLTSADGDYLIEQAQQQLDQYVTQAQGQPRGVWLAAQKEAKELEEQLQSQQSALQQYQQWVDELAQARKQIAHAEANRPWEQLREQAKQVQVQLLQARQLQERAKELQQALTMLAEREKLYQQAGERDQEWANQRSQRAAQVKSLVAKLEQEQGTLNSLNQRLEQARSHKDASQQEQERARTWQQWFQDQASFEGTQQQLQQVQGQLEELGKLEIQLAQCGAALVQLKISDEALDQLRQQHQLIQRLQHQLETISTELQIELQDGASLLLDGESIQGQHRAHLSTSTLIELPGMGQLRIIPGGRDLGKVQQQLAQTQQEYVQTLGQLGGKSLEELERRREQYREQEQQDRLLRSSMKALAPQGKAHLQGLVQAAQQRVAPQRPQGEAIEASELGRIAQAATMAEQQYRALESGWHDAREAVARTQARLEQAQAEANSLEQQWADPQRQQAQQEREQQWGQLRLQREQQLADQKALEAELAALPVSVLEQDLERLERSAQQQEQSYNEARLAAQLVQTKLETHGAQGLEEQIDQTSLRLHDCQRRCATYERRVAALRLLLSVLREQRNALTQQLHEPLQKHINHYLRLLLGKARVELDEYLAPRWLQRDSGQGLADDIDGLSFGAREQIGLIARLAYADLLQQAGRPTLLILDDVLVHSDNDRLGAMKRIIHDAAQRHQILLFTCQADKWMDMGVALRPVPQGVQ